MNVNVQRRRENRVILKLGLGKVGVKGGGGGGGGLQFSYEIILGGVQFSYTTLF